MTNYDISPSDELLIPAPGPDGLAAAARLLLAANTADFEDCDVCAVIEVDCPYHQGVRDGTSEDPDPIVWDGSETTADRIHCFLLYDEATGFDASVDDETGEFLIQHHPYSDDIVDGPALTFDRLKVGDSITVHGRWPHVTRGILPPEEVTDDE